MAARGVCGSGETISPSLWTSRCPGLVFSHHHPCIHGRSIPAGRETAEGIGAAMAKPPRRHPRWERTGLSPGNGGGSSGSRRTDGWCRTRDMAKSPERPGPHSQDHTARRRSRGDPSGRWRLATWKLCFDHAIRAPRDTCSGILGDRASARPDSHDWRGARRAGQREQ